MTLFNELSWIILLFTGLFGLTIGSFLNVVIVRYPIMLMTAWRRECTLLLNSPNVAPLKTDPLKEKPFNLASPRSHCPHCSTPLAWYHNIPLISYLYLRGRCADCQQAISIQYPLVELLTALLSILVVCQWGITLKTAMILLFTWLLIIQSVIDLNHQLLPDLTNYLLLWLGLGLSTIPLFISPTSAIFGSIAGYGVLWGVANFFYLATKKQGMGQGDFKLLAALGAWLGPLALLNVILIATVTALLVSVPLLLTKRIEREHPIPFGPFLALGGWLTLLYSPFLIRFIEQTG